nr:ABC transporter permease [Candidatus Sigynarchaeota archaeon]
MDHVRASSIILKHLKKDGAISLLVIAGVACAVASSFLFSTMRIYYERSVDDIFPQEENTVIIIEKGVPFYQIIPFGSRINESLVSSIAAESFVKGMLPALFIKPGDLGDVNFFSDITMGIPLDDIQSYSSIISNFLLIEGRMPVPSTNEVAVGVEVMGGNYIVNGCIDIHGDNYTVVGVFYPRSVLFNHVIIGDMPVFQAQFDHENVVTCIFVNLEPSRPHEESIQELLLMDDMIQVVRAQDIKTLSGPVLILSYMADLIFGILVTTISTVFICLLLVKKFQHNEKDI